MAMSTSMLALPWVTELHAERKVARPGQTSTGSARPIRATSTAVMLGQAMPQTMCSSIMTIIGPVNAQATIMRRWAASTLAVSGSTASSLANPWPASSSTS